MTCAPYPVALRIGNVSLPNSKVARGIELAIGEPAQMFALMPAVPQNNTIFYGTDGFCLDDSPGSGSWTDGACTTFRGGAYNSLTSQTRTPASASMFSNDTEVVEVTQIADTVRLNDNVTLTGFPLGVALSNPGDQSDEYFPQVDVGLGVNSSLLGALRTSGKIASRSWGFFLGSDSPRKSGGAQLDGSLVLGGFDRAKVVGNGYTKALGSVSGDCSTQLTVNITDIELNFPNSTTASIFPNSSTIMKACLQPGLASLFRLPLDPYFGNMLSLTNTSIGSLGRSLGVYYWNMRYLAAAGDPYAGALTITFQNGPSIRIPNEQLVVPHVYINQTTGDIVANATEPDLLIDSLQAEEASGMPQLGRQLFAAAYLLVNQDAGHFTLWEANPTASEDLVAVDTSGNQVTNFCAETNTTTSYTSSSNSSSSSSSSSSASTQAQTNSSLSTGATAGIVVAAVAVLSILAGLFLWWFRRRRQAQARNAPPIPTGPVSDCSSSAMFAKTDGDIQIPAQEMPALELHPIVKSHHYELQG